jgi:hypothetical protein
MNTSSASSGSKASNSQHGTESESGASGTSIRTAEDCAEKSNLFDQANKCSEAIPKLLWMSDQAVHDDSASEDFSKKSVSSSVMRKRVGLGHQVKDGHDDNQSKNSLALKQKEVKSCQCKKLSFTFNHYFC